MKLNYRKSHLTDGTQVKITEELFQQFALWQKEGYEIPLEYSDMLKKEDNAMINANRNYYIHNISLDVHMLRDDIGLEHLFEYGNNPEKQTVDKERSQIISKVLNLCSETQKRRFIKHYYLGYSKREIAKQEDCYENAVRKSILQVENLIISQKNLV